MTRKRLVLLFLQLIWLIDKTFAQRSSYSLQAAVDEMHRREAAKYPLNDPPTSQHYFSALGSAPDFWDDDSEFLPIPYSSKKNNRKRLYNTLSKYLQPENYEADDDGFRLGNFGGFDFDNNNILSQQKKRSSYFRERENKNDKVIIPSLFRERDSSLNDPTELTEQFLREIEEAQQREKEERYKDTFRNLWENFQDQGNEIEVLPLLPYSERNKRFPIVKRSPNEYIDLSKTDAKVNRELSELFGKPFDENKKHGIENQKKSSLTKNSKNEKLENNLTKQSNATPDASQDLLVKKNIELHHNQSKNYEHNQKGHKHRKRSDHHSHEKHDSHEKHEEDEEEEYSEERQPEHDDQEENFEQISHESEEDSEEDAEYEKKKRDLYVFEKIPDELSHFRKKKSIQWSKYFGIDRKKKNIKKRFDIKKRSIKEDGSNDDEKTDKNGNLDPEKLENINRKLQSIEDFIIDETIKYTGAHEGIDNPYETRQVKDHVLSRLATAYSLEKMRRALDKLRQSVDNENHLLRNVIESESHNENNSIIEKEKRLLSKKESAPQKYNSIFNEKPMIGVSFKAYDNSKEEEDNGMRKKKKRNSYLRYPELPNDFSSSDEKLAGSQYETLNDAYLGNKNYMIGSNQCPLIESIVNRCRGVEILSGDLNQELLPLCEVHQICYLCGTSKVACDYQYLAETDEICGEHSDCQSAVRSVLMILRGTIGPQLGPRECLKNSCLYSAMREIGL